MVVTKLIGGLGNQMFQYAVARRLAYFAGVQVKLDISGFREYTLRSFALNHFNIKADIAQDDEIDQLRRREGKICGALKRCFGRRAARNPVVKEKSFRFDPTILNLKPNVYLEGYWQSDRYFKDIRKVVQDDLRVITTPDETNRRIVEEISGVEAVSVHVRRGDYISNPATNAYHGVCSLDYYRKATATLASAVPNAHFFVFSDDPQWARDHFRFGLPMSYVTHNGPEQHYEDFRLMSMCRHHIIANSSFSWWAAWLSDNYAKTVIAPETWFKRKEIDTSDLMPEDWIRLPS